MNTPRRFLVGPISLLILLAACAAPGGEAGSPSPTATDDATGENGDAGMPDAPAAIPDEIWQTIMDEVAGVAAPGDGPSVVSAEAVTWSDGSLGCPEPGMGYTQALVPGYRVVIEVGGEELHFHASESGTVFLCDDPQPPVEDR